MCFSRTVVNKRDEVYRKEEEFWGWDNYLFVVQTIKKNLLRREFLVIVENLKCCESHNIPVTLSYLMLCGLEETNPAPHSETSSFCIPYVLNAASAFIYLVMQFVHFIKCSVK
ncbi:unnamed protein product [Onchocerca flexuosa]|uniref:Glycogen [starch] synthase n=1 Tax=Onchocerca flexuosa TaxID=387005 RepID=A0A183HFU7_9BILA|nr:unnamed protein product [Onchocerca flexuosa]